MSFDFQVPVALRDSNESRQFGKKINYRVASYKLIYISTCYATATLDWSADWQRLARSFRAVPQLIRCCTDVQWCCINVFVELIAERKKKSKKNFRCSHNCKFSARHWLTSSCSILFEQIRRVTGSKWHMWVCVFVNSCKCVCHVSVILYAPQTWSRQNPHPQQT